MTEGTKSSPKGGGFQFKVRGPRDFYGGLALIALAIVAIMATGDLPGQHGFAFGPGTAPRMFATMLAIVAALSATGGGQSVQSGQTFAEPLPPAPRDIPSNLAMKISGPFTVAAVGDVMIKRPAVSLDDPQYQDPIRILKNADVAFGNM